MDTGERDTLARIAAGDEAALRALYAAYRDPLWRYIFWQMDGDAEVTEEIVQDVFWAIWKSAATFRDEARVATWIFRIAQHVLSNARRAARRRLDGQSIPLPDHDGWFDDGHLAPSPEHVVLDRLELVAALHTLSAKHRQVLALIFLHGFALHEVADILSVPIGTVRSRLSYARRALLQAMQFAHAQEELP